MILTRRDLESRTLNGVFYRDPSILKEETRREERIDHMFFMYIFEFNESTGLFLARCEDEFGRSGITGKVIMNQRTGRDEYDIGFVKLYNNVNTIPLNFSNIDHLGDILFKIQSWAGNITTSDTGEIKARGRYHTKGYNNRMGGYWEINSVS